MSFVRKILRQGLVKTVRVHMLTVQGLGFTGSEGLQEIQTSSSDFLEAALAHFHRVARCTESLGNCVSLPIGP